MEFSKPFIKRIILFAVVSIIFIAVIPYASYYYTQKNVSNKAVDTYKHYTAIAHRIFAGDFGGDPKTIEGFDFDQLRDLGKQISIDFDETIKLIKKPFGSYWISDANGTVIVSLVKQLATTILKSYVKIRVIAAILTFFGFILIVILYKHLHTNQIQKSELLREDDLDSKRPSIILNILSYLFVTLLLLMNVFFIFNFIRHISSFVKYPPICNFAKLNTTSLFYFEELVLLIGIIFLISILVRFFLKKNPMLKKIFAFYWIIPIIAIGFNLFIASQNITIFYTMLDKENLNSNRQMVVRDCSKIAFSSRQWFLINEKNKKLEELTFDDIGISQQTENGIYNFSTEDNILTITGKGNYVSKDGEGTQVKVTYDSIKDFIDTEINPDLFE